MCLSSGTFIHHRVYQGTFYWFRKYLSPSLSRKKSSILILINLKIYQGEIILVQGNCSYVLNQGYIKLTEK